MLIFKWIKSAVFIFTRLSAYFILGAFYLCGFLTVCLLQVKWGCCNSGAFAFSGLWACCLTQVNVKSKTNSADTAERITRHWKNSQECAAEHRNAALHLMCRGLGMSWFHCMIYPQLKRRSWNSQPSLCHLWKRAHLHWRSWWAAGSSLCSLAECRMQQANTSVVKNVGRGFFRISFICPMQLLHYFGKEIIALLPLFAPSYH